MSTLEGSPEERRAAAERAMTMALARFEGARERPIVPPEGVDAAALHAMLDEPLPRGGQPLLETLREVEARIVPWCRENGNPRFFGYVSSSGSFVGALGDLLASSLNQNVTSWRSAPGATEVERVVVRWMKEMLGYPAEAEGLLVSGGSMANFAALRVALQARSDVDLNARGVRALAREPVVYASGMAHMSAAKGLEMMGLGRSCLRVVPTRSDFTVDVDALERAVQEDLVAGRHPFCVVANGGDVNTGAVDPLDLVAAVCRKHRLWLHVDGAYGAFAALAPEGRALFPDLALADSMSLDPHKWLYAPVDVGCLLVRDASALRRTFSHVADYIRVLEGEERAAYAFWDHGPELSRRFRALKVWMTVKHHGADGLAHAISRNVRLARRLGEMVDEAPDFERLAPVPLSIVCFRHVPGEMRAALEGAADAAAREDAEARLDTHNREVLVRLQKGGEAYVSNAALHGRFALRACIVNHRTTEADLSRLLDAVRTEASRAGAGEKP